ncbi:hypothetical protein B0H21DRAFT_826952 [Amylocystis lapponica]|nr:hypothetical protein B0H21DRAFT_826952 [Amylocystis lapponica]
MSTAIPQEKTSNGWKTAVIALCILGTVGSVVLAVVLVRRRAQRRQGSYMSDVEGRARLIAPELPFEHTGTPSHLSSHPSFLPSKRSLSALETSVDPEQGCDAKHVCSDSASEASSFYEVRPADMDGFYLTSEIKKSHSLDASARPPPQTSALHVTTQPASKTRRNLFSKFPAALKRERRRSRDVVTSPSSSFYAGPSPSISSHFSSTAPWNFFRLADHEPIPPLPEHALTESFGMPTSHAPRDAAPPAGGSAEPEHASFLDSRPASPEPDPTLLQPDAASPAPRSALPSSVFTLDVLERRSPWSMLIGAQEAAYARVGAESPPPPPPPQLRSTDARSVTPEVQEGLGEAETEGMLTRPLPVRPLPRPPTVVPTLDRD